jgi:hypothetical protein
VRGDAAAPIALHRVQEMPAHTLLQAAFEWRGILNRGF